MKNRISSKERMVPLSQMGGGGGSPLGSLVGSVVGGAMGAALGPLGVAAGSTLGSSLLGQGDLSGVTPEAFAMNALTAGMPVPGGEAAKGATEAAKGAATEGAKITATGSLNTLGTNVADNAIKSAGKTFDAAGAMSGIQGQLANVGADSAAMAATEAAKAGPLSGLSSVFNPSVDQVKDAATKGGLFKRPSTMLEHMANRGSMGVKSIFREQGGPISNDPQRHIIEHKRKLHDLEKAQMLMPLLGVLTGGGMLGQAANAMNLAEGGKACNCGPLVDCDCNKE